jgi:hypothetical protein
MDRIILDDISFDVEEKGLLELLRLRPGTNRASELLKILDEARSVAAPKAVFAVADALITGEERVEIGGINFTSRILRVNLEEAGVVYPFVATCGTGIEEWSSTLSGTLQRFWADAIMLLALGSAMARLEAYLKERLGEGARLSSMNPGSLADWPVEAQTTLFSLLGDAAGAIGVRLTEKMVIRPLKSVSGIHFVSKENFVNCSLCPRQNCASRRTAYNADLYATRYKTPA